MNKSSIIGIVVLIILILYIIFVPVSSLTQYNYSKGSNSDYSNTNQEMTLNNPKNCYKPVNQLSSQGKEIKLSQKNRTCGEIENFVNRDQIYMVYSKENLPRIKCYEPVAQVHSIDKQDLIPQYRGVCESKRFSSCPNKPNSEIKGEGRAYYVNQEKIKDSCYY